MTEPLLDGRYRLISPVAEGGMSVVWRGQDEILARTVAVKVIKAEAGREATFGDRIRREATALARLSHRHIANVYDYGDSSLDGVRTPYLVMEFVDGESLGAALRRAPLTWPTAVGIAGQVAGALAAAHAAGVVHCDITPGNVMLSADGVKVIDFGIAVTTGEYADGTVFGTPAYLAPERRCGGPAVPASDVYGLGLLLYEMLAGRLPWREGSAIDIVAAHRRVPPAPLPAVVGLPDRVAAMCTSCLAVDPLRRPSSRELELCLTAMSRAGDPRARRNLIATSAVLSERPASMAASGMPIETAGFTGAAQLAGAPHAFSDLISSAAPGTPGGAPEGPGGPVGSSPGESPWRGNRTKIMPHGMTSLPDPGRVTQRIDEAAFRSPRRHRPLFALPSLLLVLMLACLGLSGVGTASGKATSPVPAPSIQPEEPGTDGAPASGRGDGGDSSDDDSGQNSTTCRVEFHVVRQWDGGFTAQITITNQGQDEIAGWTLRFRLTDGERVGGGSNGRWREHGSAVTVRDQGYDESVPPGGTVSLGLVGVATDDGGPDPTDFTLNGNDCDD